MYRILFTRNAHLTVRVVSSCFWTSGATILQLSVNSIQTEKVTTNEISSESSPTVSSQSGVSGLASEGGPKRSKTTLVLIFQDVRPRLFNICTYSEFMWMYLRLADSASRSGLSHFVWSSGRTHRRTKAEPMTEAELLTTVVPGLQIVNIYLYSIVNHIDNKYIDILYVEYVTWYDGHMILGYTPVSTDRSIVYGMAKSLPGNEETNGLLQRLLGADSDQQDRRVAHPILC